MNGVGNHGPQGLGHEPEGPDAVSGRVGGVGVPLGPQFVLLLARQARQGDAMQCPHQCWNTIGHQYVRPVVFTVVPSLIMQGSNNADSFGQRSSPMVAARTRADSTPPDELLRLAAGPLGVMMRLPLEPGPSLIGDLEAAQLVTGSLVEADDDRGPVVLFSATKRGRERLETSRGSLAECSD